MADEKNHPRKTCSGCLHFYANPLQGLDKGECRLNPPTVFLLPAEVSSPLSAQHSQVTIVRQATFPPVAANEYCGQHTPRSVN